MSIASSPYRLAAASVLIGVMETAQGPQPLYTEIDGHSTVVAYTDVEQARADLPETHKMFSIVVAELLSQLPPYAGLVIELRVLHDVPAATSVAHANPQFGSGGREQHFIPNFADRVEAGDIAAFSPDGRRLPAHINDSGSVVVDGGKGDFIELVNLDRSADVWSPEKINDVVDGGRRAVDAVRRPLGIVTRAGRLVP